MDTEKRKQLIAESRRLREEMRQIREQLFMKPKTKEEIEMEMRVFALVYYAIYG